MTKFIKFTLFLFICPLLTWANEDLVCITPTISQSPSGTVCQGVYVSLTATGCTGLAATVLWYKDDPNSTSIGSGDNIWQSASTVGTTTYYAKCISADCPSPTTYATHTLQVSATPSSPTWVIGSFRFCANQTGIYQVTEVSGLTYSWSNFPVGSIVTPLTTSGNKVSVTFPASFSTGYAQVKASNGTCESAATNAYYEYAGAGTPQPAAFTQSTANVCKGQTYTYTVPNDANVSNYTWQYVDNQGNSLMNINGTSNSVNVYFSANTVSGTLRVSAYSNGCNSPFRSINVTVNSSPATPSSFSQSTSTVCSEVSYNFEVSPVSGINNYVWSFSENGINAEQVTPTSVKLIFPSAISSTDIYVKASNGVCESPPLVLGVNVLVTPPVPVSFVNPPTSFCKNTTTLVQVTSDAYQNQWDVTGNGVKYSLNQYDANYINFYLGSYASNVSLNVKNKATNGCLSNPLVLPITLIECCPETSEIVQDASITANIGSGLLKLNITGRKPLTSIIDPYSDDANSTGYYIKQEGYLGLEDAASSLVYTNQNCTNMSAEMYYEVIPFSLTANNSVVRLGWNSSRFINVYENSFDPSEPCRNWIGGSYRQANLPLQPEGFYYAQISNTIANKKYIAVVGGKGYFTDFSANKSTYNLEIINYNNSSKPYFLLPTSNSLYDYGFVIVKNGTIVGFSSDADLSNASTYTAGSYSTYGLSYKIGSNLSTYVGGSLTSFQTAISNQTLCAKLSNNTKSVTITACSPSAAPVVSSNKLIQCNNQAVTLTATGCSGTVKWIGDPNLSNFTGNTINTLTFSNTTYVSAMCNNNGCLSNSSNTVTILNSAFSASAEAISTTATTQSGICFSGNAIPLTYPYRANTGYQWLKDDVAISGATNATYSATAVGKYKVQITEGTCSFTSPYFHVKPIPTSPTVNNSTIQANTFGTLTATGCTGGQVNWYDAATNGNKLVMFSNTFNSPILSNTTSYYADCQVLGCNSSRIQGIINVLNPCPQNLTIISTTVSPFQATDYITTSGTIEYSSGSTSYKAGKAITILPPTTGGYWESKAGTVFEAIIEGCQ